MSRVLVLAAAAGAVLSLCVNAALFIDRQHLTSKIEKLSDSVNLLTAAREADGAACAYRDKLQQEAKEKAREKRNALEALKQDIDAVSVDELLCRAYGVCAIGGDKAPAPAAEPAR